MSLKDTVRGTTAEREVRRPPFGAPHVFVLAVIDGDDPTVVHRITRDETVIGRGEDSHLRLDNEQVSASHCVLRASGSVCTLLDRGSLNGTTVNGRRLRQDVAFRLRHLDEILLGDIRLFFLAGSYKPRGRKPPVRR